MDRASHLTDDSRVKLCTVCGVVTSRAGSRCTKHGRNANLYIAKGRAAAEGIATRRPSA